MVFLVRCYALCVSAGLYERYKKKQGLSSLLCLKCSTSSCCYIREFFASAKVNRGFEINQQIVMRSLGHGYAGFGNFNSLMDILKPMTVNNYRKTVSEIIDAVYQKY